MKFMAISKQYGLNSRRDGDGILGLGVDKDNGPLFLMALKANNVIEKAILSFYLGYNTSNDVE